MVVVVVVTVVAVVVVVVVWCVDMLGKSVCALEEDGASCVLRW